MGWSINHMVAAAYLARKVGAYLVIDDAPGVRHNMIVIPGKGMIAGPGSPKAVAHHLHRLPASFLQLLADVIGCQCSQHTAQGMA